ncbi:MAG: WXG100 family type VII secretion target [Defluviitaleaceae bacterium]|nr:WXG100 family type VII secretion target [Defluviitaleaceae bacterium]
MANEITANPAELRKYAEEIGKCHTVYRNNLHTSKSQVDSLKGVWTGGAADAFGASFQRLLDKCSEGIETLARMENALYESADAYERNEKAIQSEASKMPKLPSNTMR